MSQGIRARMSVRARLPATMMWHEYFQHYAWKLITRITHACAAQVFVILAMVDTFSSVPYFHNVILVMQRCAYIVISKPVT